jgi:exosortase E/protease (VPEID-CTERM system)
MQSASTSTQQAVGDGSRPWRAVAVLAILLAAEAAVLGWFFGDWILAAQNKRWAAFAGLLVFGGLRSHIEQHREEYRHADVSWLLVAGQILSFTGVYAALAWLASGAPPTMFGDTGSLLAAAVPAVGWLASSLSLIAPRLGLLRQLLGNALLFAAFAVTAWNVGDLTMAFWTVSSGTTMRLVELFLAPFADGPVVRPGAFVIGTDTFGVDVSAACSGFHGIGLITALLAGYLWWFRRIMRFPHALLLLPIGVMLMWLANVVRITALILVGIWISPDIAVDGFHSVAGWIAFLSVGLGLIWGASQMRFFTQTDWPPVLAIEATRKLPTTATTVIRADGCVPLLASLSTTTCLLPFLVLTAVTMLMQAFTSGFDVFYPVRVIATAAVLWYLRHDLPWRTCRIAPEAVLIGAVAFAIWMLLTPGPAASSAAATVSQNPLHLSQPWQTFWLLFRLAGSTVTVPIAEELFFRGFITRRCISADADSVPIGQFSWFSFLVSSVSFGVLHGDAWLAGVVVGMLFAGALYRRRALFDAVVAHATTNALLSGYVIATGSWSQWG